MINQKERLEILEKFLWRLNFHRTISANEKAVEAMLKLGDEFVGAHSGGSPAEIKQRVQSAYEKLRNLP